jgi:hypothetical protein
VRSAPQVKLRFLALFSLSSALIGYELAVMRSFSVGSWSNFGAMVISIALLGFGLAGTILLFIQKHVRKAPNRWLQFLGLGFLLAIAASHVASQRVPFSPVLIASDPAQILWVGIYYLIYAVPFFLAAAYINVAFIALGSRIHTLYFWNMIGSGLGGFIILGFMYILPPDYLALPLIGIVFVTVLLDSIRYEPGSAGYRIRVPHLLVSVFVLLFSGALILGFGKIKVSEYKGVSYARNFPDSALDYHSYSPIGELHVYSSSFFHFAPGLSDVASLNLQRMPERAFRGLYIDGSGPIGIMRKLAGADEAYIDYLPMSAPYLLVESPEVLLVRLGGGISAFTALHHGAQRVVIVEPNPDIIHLLAEVPDFVDYNGGLLQDARVRVVHSEPRAFSKSTSDLFDLVEISLIDSVGLSQAGGYAVDENYVYTVEAVADYMQSLKPEGVLSITVWNKLTPPRNVPKLLATVMASLKAQGIAKPEEHIFSFDLLLSTATVLIKKTPFEMEEVSDLKDFCRRLSFQVSYYPGIPEREADFDAALRGYEVLFQAPPPDEDRPEAGAANPNDLYHYSLLWLADGRDRELYAKYLFDIRPATDQRPYYTAYIKPGTIGIFLDQLGEVAEEWGYLLLLGTLLQSLFFGILIILIPLAGRWRELFKGRRGTAGIIVYYACLGMGYMLVEIFLIQRLVFFLGDPIISVSLVITSMLALSGLGSLYSRRFQNRRRSLVRWAVLGIAAALLFYVFGLSYLINWLIGLPIWAKGLFAILFIAPSAFLMGIPFPSGLSALESHRTRLLPWALGMNGALSVTGSVTAKLVAISSGFPAVLAAAILLYLVVGLVFPANESAALSPARCPRP